MDTKEITLLQRQSLMLMQSMLGVISPNFRMISVRLKNNNVAVQIILESESEEDREEIEDCQSEFEALQGRQIDFEFNVVVSKGDIKWPDESAIVIYRRRESHQGSSNQSGLV